MKDLIEALQILLKYGNPRNPTHCYDNILNVDINSEEVSEEDIKRLDELGFFIEEDDDTFTSIRFGRCGV
jgi:hypothetical protein